jgi:Right handed beta helix region
MIVASTLALVLVPGASASSPHGATLKVPSQYPTIQSAINAAHSGDTILVAPGTYSEQLTITTSVNLIGSGAGKTIIRCPTIAPASDTTIWITGGAVVTLSGFTIFANPVGSAIWVDGSTAVISDNSIQAIFANTNGIYMDSSVATITSNLIVATATPTDALEGGIVAVESQATIMFNSIKGPGALGIWLISSTGTVEYNAVTQFSCFYNQDVVAAGLCGPDWANQYLGIGIFDDSDAGPGTTIAYNFVSASDAGIGFSGGCLGCVVKGNTIVNSIDYGLAGFDGTYTFLQNTVIGGAYGVGAAATVAPTAVTLSHVLIVAPSVAPFYYEQDYGQPLPTIGGTWLVIG